MAIVVKGSGEKRHWSEVDLWSDGQRRRQYAEAPMSVKESARLEAVRKARVEADIPLPLTTTTVTDGEVLQYLRSPAMSGWSYYLLRLACWFKEGQGERFTRADLHIGLGQPGAQEEPAVAWSMSPLVVLDGDERTSTWTIGADLKFLTAEAGKQVKAGQGTLLRGYGLLSADPSWRFTATRIANLEGTHQLGMIVRAADVAHVAADVTLDVAVERQRRLALSRLAHIKGAATMKIEFPPRRPGD